MKELKAVRVNSLHLRWRLWGAGRAKVRGGLQCKAARLDRVNFLSFRQQCQGEPSRVGWRDSPCLPQALARVLKVCRRIGRLFYLQ